MNLKNTGILLAASLLGLSGCATMSGDECLTSDWHAIGYEDGSNGLTADALGNRRKACAKHGVTPNFDAYQSGRAEGLHEFCRPSRGFNLGVSGGRYNGVCPPVTEGSFLDAYNSGQQLYTRRAAVNAANAKINARQRELDKVQEKIKQNEAALIASETSVEDRVLMLAELKELSERTGQIESEILVLVEERTDAERELAAYESVLADSGL
jgi:hypothetical protein